MTINLKKNPKVLLTGGTGYIGSNLLKRLDSEGWRSATLIREMTMFKSKKLNINNNVYAYDGTIESIKNAFEEFRPDIVIHLATVFLAQHSSEDIHRLIECNLLFSTQLVEVMDKCGVKKMINTGTSWQYFQNSNYDPVNLYAATKQAFEAILKYYENAKNMKTTTIVLFDTYGPLDPRNKLINLFWKSAINQEKLEMSYGNQLIDLVYIDDVIDIYILAAKDLMSGQINNLKYGVSSGETKTVRKLADEFQRISGLNLPIIWGAKEYRPREVMKAWTNFERHPSWTPSVMLDEGILRAKPINI